MKESEVFPGVRGRKVPYAALWLLLTTLFFLGFGFSMPLLRLPVMGEIPFSECHGCSISALLVVWFGILLGGVCSVFMKGRWLRIAGQLLFGLSLFVLLVSLARLGYYLVDKRELLVDHGGLSLKFLAAGSWFLLIGIVNAFIFLALLKRN